MGRGPAAPPDAQKRLFGGLGFAVEDVIRGRPWFPGGWSDFVQEARKARVYPRDGVQIRRILWGAGNFWWYKGSRVPTQHEPVLNGFAWHGGAGRQPRKVFRTRR